MLTRIEIGVLTPSLLRDPEQGRSFLEILPDCYAPETYSDHEPINKPFTTVDDALSCWEIDFLWKRRKPRLLGHALFVGHDVHASVYISLSIKAFDLSASMTLIRRMCETFSVDIAYIHVCRSTDADDPDNYERFTMPLSQGLTTFDLRKGIPDLPWGIVFGKPYVDIFGDRLESVPVYSSEVMKDAVYLQLTENYRAVDKDVFTHAKEAAKRHLNSGVFRTSNLSEIYNVPAFNIERGY